MDELLPEEIELAEAEAQILGELPIDLDDEPGVPGWDARDPEMDDLEAGLGTAVLDLSLELGLDDDLEMEPTLGAQLGLLDEPGLDLDLADGFGWERLAPEVGQDLDLVADLHLETELGEEPPPDPRQCAEQLQSLAKVLGGGRGPWLAIFRL